MRSGSGFTEAELMAAEWSRKNKKSEYSSSSRTENYRANERKDTGTGRLDNDQYSYSDIRDRRSRSRDDKKNRRIDRRSSRSRRTDSRDGDMYKNERRRSRSRSNDNYNARHYHDKNRRDQTTTDMFGRTIEVGRVLAKPRSDSRSPSPDRRSRSRMNDTWGHDKFNRHDSPERERTQLPADYRPPSPTWISKAGGVAIIRKKTTDL